MFIHTTESIQTGLGKAPEALDAVDMGLASDKFILAVIDSQVPAIANVNQAVVTPPAIGIDDAVQGDTTSDNALQRSLCAVRDDFCVNTAVAFENAEDSRFAKGPASSLALDAAGAEVGFIHLDLARERRLGLAIFSDTFTDASQITVNGIAIKSRQSSDLSGVQIECKQPDNLAKLGLRNSCTVCVPVFHSHDSSLASLY